MPKPPLWTVPFTLAVASTAALFLGFYLLLPTVPVFASMLGASKAEVGLVVSVYSLAAMVSRLLVSRRLDRSGRRPWLLAGLAVFALAAAAYAAAGGVASLLALRVLHGVAWGWCTTALGALVADLAPLQRRGEAMGSWGLAPTVGMAVGPALGELVARAAGYSAVFLASGAGALLALAVALPIRETVAVRPEPPADRTKGLPRGAVLPGAVLFLSSLAYGAMVAFVPVALVDVPGRTGIFFMIYAAAILVARPLAGRLSDRFGRRRVILPGLLLGGAGTVLLGLAPAPVPLFAAALLIGVGIGGASFPGLMALTVDRSPVAARGGAMAVFFTAYDLAIAAGAALLGPVYDAAGFFVLNAVAAAGIGAAALLLAAVPPARPPGG